MEIWESPILLRRVFWYHCTCLPPVWGTCAELGISICVRTDVSKCLNFEWLIHLCGLILVLTPLFLCFSFHHSCSLVELNTNRKMYVLFSTIRQLEWTTSSWMFHTLSKEQSLAAGCTNLIACSKRYQTTSTTTCKPGICIPTRRQDQANRFKVCHKFYWVKEARSIKDWANQLLL